jgi:hydroxymethylpyrimidine kinase/phosphomethylpyrimidine kinase
LFEKYIAAESSILTPNYHELLALSGSKEDDPVKAGEILLGKYEKLKALVIKGGHINENSGSSADILLIRDGRTASKYYFTHPRIAAGNTHGTGCTFSSAVAAYLARGEDIKQSVKSASDYVHELIKLAAGIKIGRGNGPLPHFLAGGKI